MKTTTDTTGAEYGIFTDEGAIERDFYSFDDAEKARVSRYAEEEAHVGAFCHDHQEHEAVTCEECNGDDPEDGCQGESCAGCGVCDPEDLGAEIGA